MRAREMTLVFTEEEWHEFCELVTRARERAETHRMRQGDIYYGIDLQKLPDAFRDAYHASLSEEWPWEISETVH
jgi:hypothetical protein